MSNDAQARHGALFALGAFGLWGLAPIYFKAIDAVEPSEVLAHRIVWSVVFLLLLVGVTKKWQAFLAHVKSKQILSLLLPTALLISINWFVFIWAVGAGRIVETSLGYYINPLVSVVLAVIFLGERLRPVQWFAIAITVVGVANQIVFVGAIPLVALALAFSFGFYGLLRKKISIDPVIGITIETLLLMPVALAYLIWLSKHGAPAFTQLGASIDVLLIAAGLVTSLPLILFAAANNRLSLTSLGLFQYIAPSITFLLAIGVYDEPFGRPQLITFACIWCALAIFSVESYVYRQRKKRSRP